MSKRYASRENNFRRQKTSLNTVYDTQASQIVPIKLETGPLNTDLQQMMFNAAEQEQNTLTPTPVDGGMRSVFYNRNKNSPSSQRSNMKDATGDMNSIAVTSSD